MGSLTTANTKQDQVVHISTVEPSQIASAFTITPTRAKPWSDERNLTFSCSESQCYGNKYPLSPISISTVSAKWADPRYADFMLRLLAYSDQYLKITKTTNKQNQTNQNNPKFNRKVDQQWGFQETLSDRAPNSTEMGIQLSFKSQSWIKCCRQVCKSIKEGALWFKTQLSLCSRVHMTNIPALKDITTES